VRWLPLFGLASLLAPSSALAGTDARVRSARATLAIDEHAHAHVTLDVTVRVDGGWLEGFELDGLDPDLVLDPSDPVTLVRAPSVDEGSPITQVEDEFSPRVEVHDGGRIALALTRRRAPRRGDYVVHVAYDTVLAGRATSASADGVTIRWTFPAWRYGLDSVAVDIVAPAGARALALEDQEIDAVQADEAGGTRITLTRAHLARTREWPIEILVPLAAVDASLAVVPDETAPSALVSSPVRARPWNGAIALLVAALLVAIRVARSSARTQVERSVEHPLVPLSSAWRARLIVLVGLALAAVDTLDVPLLLAPFALAVLALAVSRRPPSVLPPKLGSFRHATPSLLRAARRASLVRAVGADAWLDATTLPGLLAISALACVVFVVVPREALGAGLLALALVVHAFLVDARASRPEPALVTLDRLVRLAARTRVSLDGPAIVLLPVVHLGVGGEAHEARLRVVGSLDTDVLRTDVVVVRRGLFRTEHGLLVVARRGGAADQALAQLPTVREIAAGSERIARCIPIRDMRIDEAFAVLARALTPVAAEASKPASVAA
jgi:hypothetical protein